MWSVLCDLDHRYVLIIYLWSEGCVGHLRGGVMILFLNSSSFPRDFVIGLGHCADPFGQQAYVYNGKSDCPYTDPRLGLLRALVVLGWADVHIQFIIVT